MARIYNFSAGPSCLPEPVLLQAREELLDWRGRGMSVMEMSHRSDCFISIANEMKQTLIELLNIPNTHDVLFLQGGASSQFAFIPLNLLGTHQEACYVNTGAWSMAAIEEAKRYCKVSIAASAESNEFRSIPDVSEWLIPTDSAYLHYTSNETIHGVQFKDTPQAHVIPMVCDMSSDILSRPVDVSKYGLIYAGAQKNMGPSGVTVVIIRKDLLDRASPIVPSIFNYQAQSEADSMLNTPATYNWYLLGLVLKWLKELGGVEFISVQNQEKAEKLYQAIDESSLYCNSVDKQYRSNMNVPFTLHDTSLEKAFLSEANNHGLNGLKGHRMVGGMRASIYNAMPVSGVDALIDFMQEFERSH